MACAASPGVPTPTRLSELTRSSLLLERTGRPGRGPWRQPGGCPESVHRSADSGRRWLLQLPYLPPDFSISPIDNDDDDDTTPAHLFDVLGSVKMVVPTARRTARASASLVAAACMTGETASAFISSPKSQLSLLSTLDDVHVSSQQQRRPNSRLKQRLEFLKLPRPATSPLFLASNNNNDQDADGADGKNEGYKEGEALAAEFYDLVRSKESSSSAPDENDFDDEKKAEREEYRRLLEQQRRIDEQEQQQQQRGPQSPEPKSPLTPEEEAEIRGRDAFSNRREVSVSKDGVVQSSSSSGASDRQKKFTGAGSSESPRLDSMGSPSAGLFSGRGGSVFSYPDGSVGGDAATPADAGSSMMQREFNLVSWASGAGFYALAALLAVSLAGVVYVGVTGGITDGSERFVGASEFNVLGDFTQEGNGITPEDWKDVVPPKMEGTSVWL